VSLLAAATYLGISYWTVRELINRQEIPAVRIGRRVMLDVDDLDGFIEANKSRSELF
jgi:excisionase family DNA binding protein